MNPLSQIAESAASKLAREFLDTQYEKIRLLRQTEKSEVWLASDQAGKLVVLKRLSLKNLPCARLKELSVSICPQIYYFVETAAETMLVEEYIQGEPLVERLRIGRYLSETDACRLILQLCHGLTALHEAGIIHRDIKPANLIIQDVSGALFVRLIDFDAARTMKEDSQADTRLLGTKGYAPPEQYGYGQTDVRSDIYSLGVTFLEALDPKYRGWLRRVLARCTEIDPKRRYTDAQKLAQAIRYHKFLRWGKFILAGALIITATVFWGYKPDKQISPPKPKEKTAQRQEAAALSPAGRPAEEPPIKLPPPPSHTEDVPSTETPAENHEQEVSGARDENFNSDANSAQRNRVHAYYYFNGERLDEWTDALDTPVAIAGKAIEIPSELWRGWSGAYPPDWNVSVRIENQSSNIWKNPYLAVVYDDLGKVQKNILHSENIAPGESIKLVLPLSQFAINGNADNNGRRTFTLSVHGEGSQEVFGPQTKLDFNIKQ